MKIKKLIINNFRAFKHVVIDYNDFNCIIGKNDTGKSTILAALEWFFNPDKELNKNDFAVAGFDWIESTTPSYYDETTGETRPEETRIEPIFDGLCLSVDVYFDDVVIPECSESYDFIFDKDFINDENCICISKCKDYPLSYYDKGREGYSVKTTHFKRMSKILSDCSFEELMTAYNEIGKDADKLCKTLKPFEEERKNKTGLALAGINSRIRAEKVIIKKQMCEEIYRYYYDLGEIREEKWKDYIDKDEWASPFSLIFPEYKLYTSKTPIEDYLNDLFTPQNAGRVYKSINEAKEHTTTKITDIIGGEDCGVLYYDKNEKIGLFTEDSLLFKMDDLPPRIPLRNRGEGTQLRIKNAAFRLLAEIQSKNGNSILFAFEEPETHLHPSAQLEVYETIKTLSENTNYQVINTTHSPYIVKELADTQNSKIIIVKREKGSNESTISHLEERVLPYVSMNEINYIAFDYASEEYHQELYGKIEMDWFGASNGSKMDDIINTLYDLKIKKSACDKSYSEIADELLCIYNSKNHCNYNLKKNVFISPDKQPQQHSICHCVRNAIDHPFNENKHWKSNGSVELSTKILIEANNYIIDLIGQFQRRASSDSKLDEYGKKQEYYVSDENGILQKQSHSSVFWTYHCYFDKISVYQKSDGKNPVKKYAGDVINALNNLHSKMS